MKKVQITIQKQFDLMCQTGKLYRVEASDLWETYLNQFEKEIFRDPSSSAHNCNICHSFIRRYGNIVAISPSGGLMTIFQVEVEEEYKKSFSKLTEIILDSKIKDVFFETFEELNSLNYEKCKKDNSVFQLGIKQNFKKYTEEEVAIYGKVNSDEIYTFNHLSLTLPRQFVDFSGKSIESITASYREKKQVFKRAMEEISLDTLNLVKDLITQGSLLNGDSYLELLVHIIELKKLYNVCNVDYRENWYWERTYSMSEGLAKFRNTLLGTLCVELTEGKELNKACLDWNKRADPANYMKATAPITQRQIEEAKKFVEDNGYADSFDRRLATIDDIKASEILHLNSGDGSIKKISVFDNVKATSQHKRAEFDKVEEISIDKFMKDVLPTTTGLEVYVENRFEGNFCTLTKSVNDSSKNIFKYSNNYSKTFNGNLAGKSEIKNAVKERGGNTDAPVRISLSFPNTTDDYDLHAKGTSNIYYGNKRRRMSDTGMLDLDAQGGDGHFPPEKRVENITYTDISKMGTTQIMVNNYSGRGLHTPFDVEIEINGEVTLLQLKKPISKNDVNVALLVVKDNVIEIKVDSSMEIISSQTIEKEIWGVKTNNFHKVNLVCLSPNYWGENQVGNKHYMFILEGCKVDIPVRGFHNEDLNQDLLNHRKVMEVLGTTAMIEPTDKQLSGLGFNATVRDEFIVKIKGSHQRLLKIKI